MYLNQVKSFKPSWIIVLVSLSGYAYDPESEGFELKISVIFVGVVTNSSKQDLT